MKIYIYSIVNRINNKTYYGKTKRPIEQRFSAHIRAARKGRNTALKCAIRKYGAQNFMIKMLCYCRSNETASKEECRLIRLARKIKKPLYNMTDGGDGLVGYKFTTVQSKKLSRAMRGRPMIWAKKIHAIHRQSPQRYAAWKKSISNGMQQMSAAKKTARMKKIWATRRRKAMRRPT